MNFHRAIEVFWRHYIVYPVLRKIFNNKNISDFIDIRNVRKILFLRYDRIGDMIVTTPIFRYLKDNYPHLHIAVFASEKNYEIVSGNPCIDALYILHKNVFHLLQQILKARKNKYDVIINLIFNRTTTGALLANIISRNGVKVGQGDEKYRFYFNKLLKIPRRDYQMTSIISSMLEQTFGIQVDVTGVPYEIFVYKEANVYAESFLKSYTKKINSRYNCLLVNLSAVDAARRISTKQAQWIIEILQQYSIPLVVICGPEDIEMKKLSKELIAKRLCIMYPHDKQRATLHEIAALIGLTRGVISPDTSIVHFACAMRTPLLAFYTRMQDWKEWQPLHTSSICVFSQDNQPVSAIPKTEIEQSIHQFIQHLNSYNYDN